MIAQIKGGGGSTLPSEKSSSLDTLYGFVSTARSACSNLKKCPDHRAAPIL